MKGTARVNPYMEKKLSLLIVFMIGMQSGIATAESLESLQEILNLNRDLKNYRKHKKAHHTQKNGDRNKTALIVKHHKKAKMPRTDTGTGQINGTEWLSVFLLFPLWSRKNSFHKESPYH